MSLQIEDRLAIAREELDRLDSHFSTVVREGDAARRAYARSRSMKNARAVLAANERFDAALQACRRHQQRIERMEREAAAVPREQRIAAEKARAPELAL